MGKQKAIRRSNVILRSNQYSWMPWKTVGVFLLIAGAFGGWWFYQEWSKSENTSAATISKLAADTDVWVDVTDTNNAYTGRLPGKPVTISNVVSRGTDAEQLTLVEQRDTFNSDVVTSLMSGRPAVALAPLTPESTDTSPETQAVNQLVDDVLVALGRNQLGALSLASRQNTTIDGRTSRLVTFTVTNNPEGISSGTLSLTPTASGNVVVAMVATRVGGDAQQELFTRLTKELKLT
jgi:hypothetical protein